MTRRCRSAPRICQIVQLFLESPSEAIFGPLRGDFSDIAEECRRNLRRSRGTRLEALFANSFKRRGSDAAGCSGARGCGAYRLASDAHIPPRSLIASRPYLHVRSIASLLSPYPALFRWSAAPDFNPTSSDSGACWSNWCRTIITRPQALRVFSSVIRQAPDAHPWRDTFFSRSLVLLATRLSAGSYIAYDFKIRGVDDDRGRVLGKSVCLLTMTPNRGLLQTHTWATWIPVDEARIFWFIQTYRDLPRLRRTLARLRKLYSDSQVLVVSDGDPDPGIEQACQKYSARFALRSRMLGVEYRR